MAKLVFDSIFETEQLTLGLSSSPGSSCH